jgi:N-terminal domain of ribose phosphate pyrophosphokinase
MTTTLRVMKAVRSTLISTTAVPLPTLQPVNRTTTRYCLTRTSHFYSNAKEGKRIWNHAAATFDTQAESWGIAALFVAVAATVGAMTIVQPTQTQPTLCEAQCVDDDDDDEDEDEDGDDAICDPMSSYAISAIIREIKEQHDQQQQQQQSQKDGSSVASVQATSSSTNDPPPLNPSDAFRDGTIPHLSEAEAKIEEATRKAKQHSGGLKIFSGNGNMSLALEICRHLGVNLGKATVGRFADGETNVVIHENVRGKDVYIVQPTCPPVNDNMMELLLMVSTLRRSSARRITVVIPYYGYARQDRKMQVLYLSMHVYRVRKGMENKSSQLLAFFFNFKHLPSVTRPVSQLVRPMLHVLWNPWALIVSLRWICTVVKFKDFLVPAFRWTI